MVRTIGKSMTRGFSIRQAAEIALNGALDVTEEIVDAGRKAYCNLHQNHPAWTVAREFSDRSIILRAIDGMCIGDGYTPPPVPEPPFIGGQCCDINYRVQGNYHIKSCFQGNSVTGQRNFDFTVTGKIKGIFLADDRINGAGAKLYILVERCDGTTFDRDIYSEAQGCIKDSGCPTNNTSLPGAFCWSRELTDFTITSVTPSDGSADTCGSPPADYPPEPPPVDGDLIQDIDITNNAGDIHTYNVTINRDTENTINFPPVIVVNNVTMTLDITGINILSNNNTNKFSGGGSGGVAEEEPKQLEDDTKGKELVVDIGAIEQDVTQLYGVIVKFASIPFNAKLSGGNGAPKIIYGGWVEFKIGANYLPRQYIDFMNSYFLAPEGATGYAVTIKVGYNATIFKAYYRDIEDGSESDN